MTTKGSKFGIKLGGVLVASVAKSWMNTLDYQVAHYDARVDPVREDFCGPVIFLFWHEYIPFLLTRRGHCDVSLLISKHGDAEWLSQAARHMGFATVRGSTNRGGSKALREMMDRCQNGNLAITPDGPRGPRRQLAMGPIYLASRLGVPLVPVGLGYQNPWRVGTWDRFAIPRLGSRARAVTGPPVYIPAKIRKDRLEECRAGVERLLNDLTTQAEEWAEGGQRLANQECLRSEAIPRWLRKQRREEAATEAEVPPLAIVGSTRKGARAA